MNIFTSSINSYVEVTLCIFSQPTTIVNYCFVISIFTVWFSVMRPSSSLASYFRQIWRTLQVLIMSSKMKYVTVPVCFSVHNGVLDPDIEARNWFYDRIERSVRVCECTHTHTHNWPVLNWSQFQNFNCNYLFDIVLFFSVNHWKELIVTKCQFFMQILMLHCIPCSSHWTIF